MAMTKRENDMAARLIERYFYHKNFVTDNIGALETLEKLIDIEITEMWMLTQSSR